MRAALLTLVALAGATVGTLLIPSGAAAAESSSVITTSGQSEAEGPGQSAKRP